MLKTSGHVKAYYTQCATIYEDLKQRKGVDATFTAFIGQVEALSQSFPDTDAAYKFKGDMLEVLAEIFFKAFSCSPVIGLSDYTPIPLVEDYGVDGKGTNAAGKECVVQMKFRANPTDLVRYEEMAKTYTSGKIQLKIPLEGDNCVYVFTTAQGVTIACQTVFGKMLRVISRDIIANEIDNNVNFWNLAYSEIEDTLTNALASIP
jgi:hypothetical protein